ncbi:DUF2510 domain-containing protein [Streptomyces specialis]|uniref:DUF2510 domain-containing protein n=1 Tax=Streptomyces specialis TaxID=498367 RepID=UPI00073EF2A9|nr:DUF2510 domain-containing protein [Streptomyces specialis]
MTTPPGWYPDPGHSGGGPAPERWWDGSAWTAHTRVPGGGPPAFPASVALPEYQPFGPPPSPAPPPGRRGVTAALVTGGGALAAVLAVIAVLVLGGDGGEDGEPRADDPGTSAGEDPGTGDDDGNGGAAGVTGATAGGVALPLLDGWTEGELTGGVSVTSGEYPCPGDESLRCVEGGAFLFVRPGMGGVPPREVAVADIGENERESYSEEAYGGVTDSQRLLAEEVTVAGQEGYRVRSRIETAAGTQAYVETVAFPAPDDSGDLVMIRLGFDIGDDAPQVADLDRLVLGVRTVSGGPGTEV